MFRIKFINFLKSHPVIVNIFWKIMKVFLLVLSLFIKTKEKTILFCSYGGRSFDDSPKALYDKICLMPEFKDWQIYWAFIEPEQYVLKRGKKVKIDTLNFFIILLSSKVWISNSGMSRGISIKKKDIIRVETWHGAPIKKIGYDQNQNSMVAKPQRRSKKCDGATIRCAQSEYDRAIFSRVFNASKDSILLSDLPRNDKLKKYSREEIIEIKESLKIGLEKKVILYMPTYREYLIDKNNLNYLAPPVNFEKWKISLQGEYVLLVRAHYAVNKAMDLNENDFVRSVSSYGNVNDLYAISDILISDYSSAFFDYSILERPMLCFAYDLEEYEQKRGLYVNLQEMLPCEVDRTEDAILEHITGMDRDSYIKKVKEFHRKYTPYAGGASELVINKVLTKLKGNI